MKFEIIIDYLSRLCVVFLCHRRPSPSPTEKEEEKATACLHAKAATAQRGRGKKRGERERADEPSVEKAPFGAATPISQMAPGFRV